MALEKLTLGCAITYVAGTIIATANMGAPEGSIGNYVGEGAIITALVGGVVGITLEVVGDYLNKKIMKGYNH